jgi:phosphoglucosamine mutase
VAVSPDAPRLFGTDGIRGVANEEPVTCETTLRVGRALVRLCRDGGVAAPRVVIGKDPRRSGDMLQSALVAGICSMGGRALLAGTLPTPAVAYLTRTLPTDAGAVVSASHNPFRDNGLKFFAAGGFKLADDAERAIERLVRDDVAAAGDVGAAHLIDDAASRYVDFLCTLLPPGLTLKGVSVAIDCAHGAAYHVGPAVLSALSAEVSAIGVSPDGENINRDAGAAHPEGLRRNLRTCRAQLGIALDGDGDRVVLVDELGEVVDGDEMLAVLASDMAARGTLRQSTVVATVMSNLGLEVALRARGLRLLRVPVGDRHVVAAMRRNGCNLGGEQSGHLILLDHCTTGDGLAAALAVMRVMLERQRPLSALKRVMTRFPQIVVNVPVRERRDLESIEPLRLAIARVRDALNDRGRVLVRYSGTEPLVRVMVEGEDAPQTQAYADDIAAIIEQHLGA